MAIARFLSPLAATDPRSAVDQAIKFAAVSSNSNCFDSAAQIVAALADRLDPHTTHRIIDFFAKTRDATQLSAATVAIGALVDRLDNDEAGSTLCHTIECFLKLSIEHLCSHFSNAVGNAVTAIAEKLDPAAADRCIDHAISIAAEATSAWPIRVTAVAAFAFGERLDSAAAGRAIDRVIDRVIEIGVEDADSRTLITLARGITSLTDKLDSKGAARILDRVVTNIEKNSPTCSTEFLELASILASRLDSKEAEFFGARILAVFFLIDETTNKRSRAKLLGTTINRMERASGIKLAKQASTHLIKVSNSPHHAPSGNISIHLDLTNAIAALAGEFDQDTAQIVFRHICSTSETTSALQLLPRLASAITKMAVKLNPDCVRSAANAIVTRVLDFAGNPHDRQQQLVALWTIIALANKLEGKTAQRASDFAANDVQLWSLETRAKAIAALADRLDGRHADPALAVVDRAILIAATTDDRSDLPYAARGIAVVAPLLPRAPVVHAAIELLKQPLGGDVELNKTAVETIAHTLGRPDLLSEFPERSFWAVMQHLAEVKAAHPDWDWLDLARPPMPADELIATFRALCANPPDWPATTAPT